jgi:hypothetical protein
MEQFYFLFVERNQDLNVENVYERLLSIVTPGILSIDLLNDELFDNVIRIRSDLYQQDLVFELTEILYLIGYKGLFNIMKKI